MRPGDTQGLMGETNMTGEGSAKNQREKKKKRVLKDKEKMEELHDAQGFSYESGEPRD